MHLLHQFVVPPFSFPRGLCTRFLALGKISAGFGLCFPFHCVLFLSFVGGSFFYFFVFCFFFFFFLLSSSSFFRLLVPAEDCWAILGYPL